MKLSKQEAQEIIRKTDSFMGEGISNCDKKHSRAEENQIYANVEQWSKGDILKQQLKDRPAIPWNSIFKIVQAIANREIVERFVPKVFGREKADAGIANVLDEMCRWQRDQSMSEQLESGAIRSTVISGIGWMHKYWDQSKLDGDGMIVDEDVPVWEMLWPARARRINLSDRRWHIRGKWVTVDEAKARWSDVSVSAAKKFENIEFKMNQKADSPITTDTSLAIGQAPTSSAFGWGTVQTGDWMNIAEREVFVIEAEWIEPVVSYKVAMPTRFSEWEAFVAGAMPEIAPTPEDEEAPTVQYNQYLQMGRNEKFALQSAILMQTDLLTIDTRKELDEFAGRYEETTGTEFEDFTKVIKEEVKYAIRVDDEILDYGNRPWGFSYHAITGFPVETREGMDFLGVVDYAKGPQDYKNALLSNMMAMYMASPKAPLLIERGAIPDMDEFINRIASPSAVVPVPDGFLSSNKMQILPSPQFPSMSGPLLDFAARGVEETFGMSSIDLGTQSDLRRVSGTVVQAAKAANNVIVAIIFDGIRYFRKMYGLCNVKFITEMYSPSEIIRIIGDEKAEDMPVPTPEVWGKITKFDIVIDEQPSSPSELMELVDFLTRTGTLDKWIERKDITFEDSLRLMPQIPESDKRAMLKGKTTQDQLAQAQQTNAKLQELVDIAINVPEAAQAIVDQQNKQQINESLQQ